MINGVRNVLFVDGQRIIELLLDYCLFFFTSIICDNLAIEMRLFMRHLGDKLALKE